MTYEQRVREGDRVALAPHLDLWWAGVRYATVAKVTRHPSGVMIYKINPDGRHIPLWVRRDDLLGTVTLKVVK